MLLRRVTRHVQSQNWFAVFVDFVIVVVGVFVGLQVQDWNDARKERIQERELLARLSSETRALLNAQGDELDVLRERGEVLTGVNPVLFSIVPSRPISPKECRYIISSHVYRRPPDELPVLDEMLETGRFNLLRDPVIKENLRGYVLLRESARSHYSEVVNELFRLHSRFPSLIAFKLVPEESASEQNWTGLSGDGFRWSRECDVDLMRSNTAFLNEYVDNLARIETLTDFLEQRIDHLEGLRRLLTDENVDATPRSDGTAEG